MALSVNVNLGLNVNVNLGLDGMQTVGGSSVSGSEEMLSH